MSLPERIAVAGFGGYGAGAGSGSGGSGQGGAAQSSHPLPQLQEAELQSLLRLLGKFGEAANSKEFGATHPAAWQQSVLPRFQPTHKSLCGKRSRPSRPKSPSAKIDEAMLLRLAENLAIRFALDRFQRGEVRVNAVRQMLDKHGPRTRNACASF